MKRASLALLILPVLAACQVTVVPSGTPGASAAPGASASARPGQTPKPKASPPSIGVDGGASIRGETVPGPIAEIALPAEAREGEEVRLVADVVLSSGCIGFADAKAEVDEGARRVTVSALVTTGPPNTPCSMAIGHHKATLTFTPATAGAWTVVALRPNREPLESTLEVLAAGASPAPSASPSASAAPDGWTREALVFTSLRAPEAARAGVATAIGFEARIGSSSCAAFEEASAVVDAEARVVRVAGTKRVAPPGTSCTKDLRSHTGELAVTLPEAGSWTIEAAGAGAVTFEVAP